MTTKQEEYLNKEDRNIASSFKPYDITRNFQNVGMYFLLVGCQSILCGREELGNMLFYITPILDTTRRLNTTLNNYVI